MKAPWFIDGVTTDTNGVGPSSGSTLLHCSRRPAQLSEKRDFRSHRVARPEQAEAEACEAVPVALPTNEARVERGRWRPEDVLYPGHHAELPAIPSLQPEVTPVLPDKGVPADSPVMRDGVVARVLDGFDPKPGKGFRARVDGGTELCSAAAGERPLPADSAPDGPAQGPVAKEELPRAIDDPDIGGEARNELCELRSEDGRHHLVRVHEQQPVVGRLADQLHSRPLRDRDPVVTKDAGTMGERNSFGVVAACDVDDDHLVAKAECRKAAFQKARLIVARDHRRDGCTDLKACVGAHLSEV